MTKLAGQRGSPSRPSGTAVLDRPAIRTEDLRKTYKSSRGNVDAVRGIDLDVAAG